MTSDAKLPIAIALGDPNGIGPEIAVKAAAEISATSPGIVLVGDEHVIQFYQQAHAPHCRLQPFSPADRPTGNIIRYVPVDALDRDDFKPGIVSAPAGRATVAYVEAALKLARQGAASAIIGCPHNETAVNAAGISFSGYPSLLARLTGTPEERVFMMLVGGGLRILHATLHERLQHALGRLSVELVETAGKECASALRGLGFEKPTIGVFGINPHAGENGLFGDDDDRITVPAVARLRSAGLQVEGPVGADLMLGRKDIDGFVAIYHDQGHIPVKLVAGRRASALTVGTGVLFSSVGHGSAFDIAGKGKADPEGILRTIDLLSRPTGSKQAVTDS